MTTLPIGQASEPINAPSIQNPLIFEQQGRQSPEVGAEQLVDNTIVRRQAAPTKDSRSRKEPSTNERQAGIRFQGSLTDLGFSEINDSLSDKEIGLYQRRDLRH